MESGFKPSSTSPQSVQQVIHKSSGPERQTTTLLLSQNGSLTTLSATQVKSVLSTLDSNQQLIIQQHVPLPHQQIVQLTQDSERTGSKKPGDVDSKRSSTNLNFFKEKQSAECSGELSEWRDEKNIKWIEIKSQSLEEGASVSPCENDVEVIFMEDVPIETSGINTYSKFTKMSYTNGEDENLSTEKEENKQTFTKRRKKKLPSPEKSSINLIEQVACYKCKFCMFLSLSQDAVTVHVQQEHASQIPTENNCSMQCPGCSNIFYSQKSLRVHLSEDHNVAQEELENILSNFKANDREDNTPQSNLNSTLIGEEHQGLPDAISEIEIVQDSTAGIGLPIQTGTNYVASGIIPSESYKDVKEACKDFVHNKSVLKGNKLLMNTSVPDETGKIRVRKLSSLEKSQQENGVEDINRNDVPRAESSSNTVEVGQSSTAPDHMYSSDQGNIQDGNIPINIQYDIESMEILDIPLDQQPNESQELVGEVHQQSADVGNTLQSIVDDNGHRYCAVPTSPAACEAIIDEICQEEVLDNVLYVEEGEIMGDNDSPIVVCFAASPNYISGNGDYDVQIEDNISTGSGGHSIDDSPERIVLSSCTFFDGTDVVGSDGKKLVKRGFVKRAASKKSRIKKPKMLKKKLIDNDEEPTIAGYKCNVYGCSVRLLSHDNMEYHQRCHVPNYFAENTLKDTLSENENIPESKRRRILVNKHTFDCPECAVGLHTWKQMRSHLWKSHSIDMELYSCEHCEYKTPSLSNMKNVHVKIHGSEKPFLCDSCGKGFKTTKQLRNHKVIHIRKEAGVQTCETCGRTFHTNRMLRSHINTVHNKVRPYMCSECGHTAANRSSLKMHLRQHTGDRPYECDQCEYTTADHNSLRRHKKRHTGDKPYKCPICSYACIQSSTFKVHLRTKHPGQDLGLMFSCKKCSFHSVNHDIYLAHAAEHDLAESCGIPFKSAPRPSQRRSAKHVKISDEFPCEEVPIYVSIATDDTANECEQPNFENIVQHVSEEIVPGSNLHVLYNSISLSDSNIKENVDCSSTSNVIARDPIIEIIEDDSELEGVAEVDKDTVIEIPTEEYKFKLRNTKMQI